MDRWKVGWALENGHIKQTQTPGHDRPRCVYVDFLNTGPAVSRTLRTQLNGTSAGRRVGDVLVTDIVVHDGEAVGAIGTHLLSGEAITLEAKAVVVATGGLTRLFRRNSPSANMGGDGYALALRAGVELVDMEFVQFFPIGHLAPRLIGMDPIMWDPFRYKRGIRVDECMETHVPNLFPAGEAVGGVNGANRLSGNAITEAMVFGELAGTTAAARAKRRHSSGWNDMAARQTLDLAVRAVRMDPILRR